MSLSGTGLFATRTFRMPTPAIIDEVFVPAWRHAERVEGAFGWFNAGWISWFAPGVADYLARTAEPVVFTIAPALFSAEHDALVRALDGEADQVLAPIRQALEEASTPDAGALAHHAVACLAWMVLNDRLRLRFAMPIPGSNYHPKVWIFHAGDEQVVVHGSANATTRGLGFAIEHLDVDTSWDSPQRVREYQDMVADWHAGNDPHLLRTVELDAEALRSLVRPFAAAGMPTREDYEKALELELAVLRAGKHSPPKPPPFRSPLQVPSHIEWDTGRFRHQGAAIRAWEQAGRQGVTVVATGGGKTILALVAAQRLHEETQRPLALIIAVPTERLVHQWVEEVRLFGVDPVAPTLSAGERRQDQMESALTALLSAQGSHAAVFVVTFDRLVESGFQSGLQLAKALNPALSLMLVGDEVHGLGARKTFARLPAKEFFDSRLGLSATFEREYDPDGTEALLSYFGEIVATFDLGAAIRSGALVPYLYHLSTVDLSADELAEYRRLGAQVGRAMSTAAPEEALSAALARRRAVLEAAEAKYGALRLVLRGIEERSHVLVYVSSKNVEQMERTLSILRQEGWSVASITQDTPSELRSRYLEEFASGKIQALVAKKILDEGVNVPATRAAILMASSTTMREWVQRRGRVLRRHDSKTHAEIYDIAALPPGDNTIEDVERRIVDNELNRVAEFTSLADNTGDAQAAMRAVYERYAR